MAGPLVSRQPTCLACLRRLAQPFAHPSSTSAGTGTGSAVSLVQARAKSNHLRPRDQGVVVRLLEDIPKFGRKDAIFKVERGRMRNQWYPKKRAEYMTPTRFRELGLTRDDIGERDTVFGTAAEGFEDLQEPVAPTPTVYTASPEKTHTILSTLIPATLTFHRKPIPAPAPAPAAPAPAVSPLIATAVAEPAPESDAPLAIYGSVSATDIVGYIKSLLAAEGERVPVVLGPENVRFLGLAEESDRIKVLGSWEVEISPGGVGLEPVRKVVEILPLVEGSSTAAEAQPLA